MKKPKYEETVTVDDIQCIWCGEFFAGDRATNYCTQETTATCPKCGMEMSIFQSVEYTAYLPD